MVTAVIVVAVTYVVFGPVRLVPENQCTRQSDGSELCTLMMLPPSVPASLFGFTATWWVPLLVVSIAGLALWRIARSSRRVAQQAAASTSTPSTAEDTRLASNHDG